MNEGKRFGHLKSKELAVMIEGEEFEVRFARCISDPVAYLEAVRLHYLDEHEGDTTELVCDVVDEFTGYVEHADRTLPQLDQHPQFKSLLEAHDAEDFDLAARYLFSLLKEAGFLREEVDRYLAHTPNIAGAEDRFKWRGERVIFNEIYGNQ
jgi:hypothetical protein